MAQENSLLKQVGDGIANAFGLNTEPIPTIQKGKGVLMPKLTPVPTVKRGKNANVYAAQMQAKEAQRTAKMNQGIASSNQRSMHNSRAIETLRTQVEQNQESNKQVQAQSQAQQAEFNKMMLQWEQRNAAQLRKLNRVQRAQLRKDYAGYAKKLTMQQNKGVQAIESAQKRAERSVRASRPAPTRRPQPRVASNAVRPTRPQRQASPAASNIARPSRPAGMRRNAPAMYPRRRKFQPAPQRRARGGASTPVKKYPTMPGRRAISSHGRKSSTVSSRLRLAKASGRVRPGVSRSTRKPKGISRIARKAVGSSNIKRDLRKKPLRTIAKMHPAAVGTRLIARGTKKVFKRLRRRKRRR